MLIASRKYAFILLAGLAFLAVGCSSNNKGKIEGKWKITALPEKGSGKNDMAEMTKVGIYVYMEFKPDGGLVFGVSSDKPEVLDFMKAAGAKQKFTWDAKYKLLPGDAVEIYDLPKDLQSGETGLFSKKDRAKVMIKITGTEMKMTDDDGTATLTKMQ